MTTDFGFVVNLFHITVGILLLAAVVLTALVFVRKQQVRILSLAVMCLIAAVFQYLTAEQLSTSELMHSIELRRLRNYAAMLFPFFILLFICSFKVINWAKPTLFVAAAVSLVFIALNYLMPFTTLFVEPPVLATQLWGEYTYYYLQGTPSLVSSLFYIYFSVVVSIALYGAFRMYVTGKKLVAVALACYFLLQFAFTLYNRFTDYGLLNAVQTDGFAFLVFLSFICTAMIVDYQKATNNLYQKTISLSREVKVRAQLEAEKMKLVQLVEQEPIATQVIDSSGVVIQANKSSLEFWQADLVQQKFNLLAFVQKVCEKNGVELDLSDSNFSIPDLDVSSINKDEWPNKIICKWLRVYVFGMTGTQEEQATQQYCIRVRDISNEQYVQSAIKQIAQGVVGRRGEDFFQTMTLCLNQIFSSDYAFVSKLTDDKQKMLTLSVAQQQNIVDNFTYQLKHTPCEDALKKDVCWYAQGVQQHYPNDIMLQEMAIEGYIGSALKDSNDNVIGILVVLSLKKLNLNKQVHEIIDIFTTRAAAELQMQQAEHDIRMLAYHDYLTELPNRANLLEQLGRYLKRAKQHQHAALLLLDLDNFKYVNDSLGDDVADELLRAIGRRLSDLNEALVARYGGDEFVIVSQFESAECIELYAHKLAKKIIDIVAAPVQIGERIVNIATSIGICIFPQQSQEKLEILRFAETALLQAKKKGRGSFYLFDPKFQQQIESRIALEEDLRRAIGEGEFSLMYQPQVDKNGVILGAEALIRWISEKNGFVSPMIFIPLAEESGLIHAIGDWVIENALSQMVVFSQSKNFQSMSINVSAWQFADNAFVSKLIAASKKHAVEPGRITLELTETGLLQNIQEARSKLTQLREAGFKIALDDFGTGYSSLSYLRDLPLDELKIDKAFVDEIDGESSTPLVESMISIARHLSLDVVAEGVEHQVQLQALVEMGCVYFQGYHFAKPMPAKALIELLQKEVV
ncbi:EAL domain-containing protein [Catenovulum sediminis]|uniref:EAL domain-containing protein n=1 Tax=Catenovulum sediminis TaxID=1740262 RepID=A0ABV1RML0_9ALTE